MKNPIILRTSLYITIIRIRLLASLTSLLHKNLFLCLIFLIVGIRLLQVLYHAFTPPLFRSLLSFCLYRFLNKSHFVIQSPFYSFNVSQDLMSGTFIRANFLYIASNSRFDLLLHLHKNGSTGPLGRVPSIEIDDSQRENTAGRVRRSMSTFLSML